MVVCQPLFRLYLTSFCQHTIYKSLGVPSCDRLSKSFGVDVSCCTLALTDSLMVIHCTRIHPTYESSYSSQPFLLPLPYILSLVELCQAFFSCKPFKLESATVFCLSRLFDYYTANVFKDTFFSTFLVPQAHLFLDFD